MHSYEIATVGDILPGRQGGANDQTYEVAEQRFLIRPRREMIAHRFWRGNESECCESESRSGSFPDETPAWRLWSKEALSPVAETD